LCSNALVDLEAGWNLYLVKERGRVKVKHAREPLSLSGIR
jgi:hypothetical protein